MLKRQTHFPHTTRNWTESDFRLTLGVVDKRAVARIARPKTRQTIFMICQPDNSGRLRIDKEILLG